MERGEWSSSSPGKSGYLYFTKIGGNTPLWEFSPCDVAKIADLGGKALEARFYGMYTPGRGDTALGWTGGCLHVTVGQLLLARTVDDRDTVFVIQIVAQKQTEEEMTARCAVVQR